MNSSAVNKANTSATTKGPSKKAASCAAFPPTTQAASSSDLDDIYRKPNETEREWQLRKLFIERFYDHFEHDRLLCLAQCYANIKTMGCRYFSLLRSISYAYMTFI